MLLIEKHADLNSTNKRGETPLDTAAQAKRWPVVESLLQMEADDRKGTKSVILWMAEAGDLWMRVVAMAKGEAGSKSHINVNAQDKSGRTAINWAAQEAQWDTVVALADHGGDVNARGQVSSVRHLRSCFSSCRADRKTCTVGF
eukprot:m.115397 g.115397  ORF g.115397 m.115397 type:complete len:144 (-) comp21562_c0_seq6:4651-5082(-)